MLIHHPLSKCAFASGRLAAFEWEQPAGRSGSCSSSHGTDGGGRGLLRRHGTVSELLRVLAYPKFKLTRDEQQTLLAEFLPYVETVKIETTPEVPPRIRDADDIIFLVLAAAARADALVSGDGEIQAVKAQFHIPIFTVAEFADWLQGY